MSETARAEQYKDSFPQMEPDDIFKVLFEGEVPLVFKVIEKEIEQPPILDILQMHGGRVHGPPMALLGCLEEQDILSFRAGKQEVLTPQLEQGARMVLQLACKQEIEVPFRRKTRKERVNRPDPNEQPLILPGLIRGFERG